MNNKTLSLLIALAEARDLRANIQALFRGDVVNISENKPALHSALHANAGQTIWVDEIGNSLDMDLKRANDTYHVVVKNEDKMAILESRRTN